MERAFKITLLVIAGLIVFLLVSAKTLLATYVWFYSEHVVQYKPAVFTTPDTTVLSLPPKNETISKKPFASIQVPLVFAATDIRAESDSVLVIVEPHNRQTYSVIRANDIRATAANVCAILEDDSCQSQLMFIKTILNAHPDHVGLLSSKDTKLALTSLLSLKQVLAPHSTTIAPFLNEDTQGYLFTRFDGGYFAIIATKDDQVYHLLFEKMTEAEVLQVLANIQ